MIDARIAQKITTACSHSVPVPLMPCPECVHRHLVSWEDRIRKDTRDLLADEVKQEIEGAAKIKSKFADMQKSIERLSGLVTRLESDKSTLQSELNDAKGELANMRIQLHAVQAAKAAKPWRDVVSE